MGARATVLISVLQGYKAKMFNTYPSGTTAVVADCSATKGHFFLYWFPRASTQNFLNHEG